MKKTGKAKAKTMRLRCGIGHEYSGIVKHEQAPPGYDMDGELIQDPNLYAVYDPPTCIVCGLATWKEATPQ